MIGIKAVKQIFFKLFKRKTYQKIIKTRNSDIQKVHKNLILLDKMILKNTAVSECRLIAFNKIIFTYELKIYDKFDIYNTIPVLEFIITTIDNNTIQEFKEKGFYYAE